MVTPSFGVELAALTAFLPSIQGEMNVGSPPEISLHILPISWKVWMQSLVLRLISVEMYQPPKLLWCP